MRRTVAPACHNRVIISGSGVRGSNGSNGGGADTAKPTSAHKPTHPIQNGTDDSLEPITER